MEKTILITGCSSGIGYYVAKQLQQRGYRVFATARKIADVEKLKTEGLESLQLDLADSASIQAAVKAMLKLTDGKLDALFNNGAYGQPGAVEDLSRTVLREQFETNLFGWMELTNAVIPIMRKQGQGRIIHNSSILGFMSMPYRGAYNASKHALEGLADTQRLELHGSGIFISLIQPGPIRSRFRENGRMMFLHNIAWEQSFYREKYQSVLARLEKEGNASKFTQSPDAVYQRVIHALENPRPQIRYYVTFPTYLFATLRRILPYRWMDWVIRHIP
ncbi:SDR family oxidoreductase [Candidatus Venteria ishoeyi]|uniref:3-oxoacyl-[acyl-carrier-protein] reductase FabG n=1 Tax=Candidatus Venteria ishoeyi TaxID=1899563 RepID=A0A1H6FA14_9GAMM|nr:SDR family oxidoreductase [Candidatus Venteria ishoeyi]SEH06950.1 3-oxoacyl-[acyl-carrier-protein] reductase FabG [Candidatus Venteria ishoeyi]